MSNALTYIHYIISKCINFVFNDMAIQQGVTVGWIAIVVIVFSMLISSILNLPRKMSSFDMFRAHSTSKIIENPDGTYRRYRIYSKRRY